jgi:hypothetical protein
MLLLGERFVFWRVMIVVFWKRKSRPIWWHQFLSSLVTFFISLHIFSLRAAPWSQYHTSFPASSTCHSSPVPGHRRQERIKFLRRKLSGQEQAAARATNPEIHETRAGSKREKRRAGVVRRDLRPSLTGSDGCKFSRSFSQRERNFSLMNRRALSLHAIAKPFNSKS